MRTILLVEKDHAQIVCTPENDFEKAMLRQFTSASYRAHIHAGSYYDCRGGFTRQTTDDHSLVVVLKEP